jgi:hypothetical protein
MEYNPIRTVDGVAVKCPSAYKWKLEDLSASDAGRTESTVMDKKRIGQIVGVELSWNKVSISDASTILKMFNPEYVEVCYLDAMEGKFVTTVFYVGERSAPLYNAELGFWDNISFNLIERSGV